MKIIILGAPGSGKGTVAARLAKDFNLKHLSTGALLRDEIAKGTEVGKEIKRIIESGDLVPDHLAIEVTRLFVDGRDNYILDGFPRTLHQAKDIKDLEIDLAIYLDISSEDAIARISGRRICEKGHTFHVKYIPPKKEGICDYDGTKLIQRQDDNSEVIKERFIVYTERTKPIIEFYKKEGKLRTVNGKPLPDVVYESVKKVVNQS